MGGTLLKVNINTNDDDDSDGVEYDDHIHLNIKVKSPWLEGLFWKSKWLPRSVQQRICLRFTSFLFFLICCLVKTLKVTMSLSAASAFSSWSAWSASPTLRRWSWPGIHWSAQRWLIRASSSSHTFKERETSSNHSNISLALLNHALKFSFHTISLMFRAPGWPFTWGKKIKEEHLSIQGYFGFSWLNLNKSIWSQRWYYYPHLSIGEALSQPVMFLQDHLRANIDEIFVNDKTNKYTTLL